MHQLLGRDVGNPRVCSTSPVSNIGTTHLVLVSSVVVRFLPIAVMHPVTLVPVAVLLVVAPGAMNMCLVAVVGALAVPLSSLCPCLCRFLVLLMMHSSMCGLASCVNNLVHLRPRDLSPSYSTLLVLRRRKTKSSWRSPRAPAHSQLDMLEEMSTEHEL